MSSAEPDGVPVVQLGPAVLERVLAPDRGHRGAGEQPFDRGVICREPDGVFSLHAQSLSWRRAAVSSGRPTWANRTLQKIHYKSLEHMLPTCSPRC